MTAELAGAPAGTPTTSHSAAQIQLPIEGMTCASCVNRIERFLRKTPGVEEATVNLATEVVTIRYLPDVAGRTELVGAIEAAGYEVQSQALAAAEDMSSTLVDEADVEAEERARERRTLLIQAATSIAVAVGIMVLMFWPQTVVPDGGDQQAGPLARHLHPVLGRRQVLPGGLAGDPPCQPANNYFSELFNIGQYLCFPARIT